MFFLVSDARHKKGIWKKTRMRNTDQWTFTIVFIFMVTFYCRAHWFFGVFSKANETLNKSFCVFFWLKLLLRENFYFLCFLRSTSCHNSSLLLAESTKKCLYLFASFYATTLEGNVYQWRQLTSWREMQMNQRSKRINQPSQHSKKFNVIAIQSQKKSTEKKMSVGSVFCTFPSFFSFCRRRKRTT